MGLNRFGSVVRGLSREDIHRSLRKLFSGKSPKNSRGRDKRDCSLTRARLTLLGRGGRCGTAGVYVHCRRTWSDLPEGG